MTSVITKTATHSTCKRCIGCGSAWSVNGLAHIAVRQRQRPLRTELPSILATLPDMLSPRMARVIEGLAEDWRRLDQHVEELSSEIEVLPRPAFPRFVRRASGQHLLTAAVAVFQRIERR
jgi:hypothetical protein